MSVSFLSWYQRWTADCIYSVLWLSSSSSHEPRRIKGLYVINIAEGKWPEREVDIEEEEKAGIMREHISPWLFSTKAQNNNVKNVCEAGLIFYDYSDSWSNQHRRAFLPTQIHISLCQKCQFIFVKLCKQSRKELFSMTSRLSLHWSCKQFIKIRAVKSIKTFFFHGKHVKFLLRQESQVTK